MNKGRDDMFKPNQLFLNVVGLFFAHNLPHRYEGSKPFVHAEHSALCGDARDRIRRFAFHVFLLPFVAESTIVVADEEGRAAFFVPLRQPAPERFSGNKATTIVYYANICIYPAHSSSAPV